MDIWTLFSTALAASGEMPQVAGPMVTATCCVTGETCTCVPRGSLLGASFTAQQGFAAPSSPWIGAHVAACLSYKWERMSCWFVDGHGFRRLQSKAELRGLVMEEGLEAPWAGYVTTSYKKHGCMITPVNAGNTHYWGFDDLAVDVGDPFAFRQMFCHLVAAKQAGLPMAVLQTLDADPALVRRFGARQWLAFRGWAERVHLSPRYGFCLYLLPSAQELKEARP